MRRRTRFISGLVVLVALALSLVEGAWAATCASMEGMSEAVAMTDGAMPDMPSGHDCASENKNAEPAQDEHDPHCPFGPAGMNQGCVAAASLPASTIAIAAPSPEDAAAVQTVETSPHLLRVAAIFHPPKA